jgi:hypothetical protein
MSVKVVLTIDIEDLSAVTFGDLYQLGAGKFEGLNGLSTCFRSIEGGLNSGTVEASVGAVAADGYVRVATGGSVAGQAMTLCNISLTARASNPATNEFVVSATAATQATNMANAINASADFAGKVIAEVSGADVLLFAVVPGAAGNGLQVAAGNLANVTVPKPFAGGSDGTTYSL